MNIFMNIPKYIHLFINLTNMYCMCPICQHSNGLLVWVQLMFIVDFSINLAFEYITIHQLPACLWF